ncbi:MAG: M23 family metallopeptidase [Erysipelotrichaceae bacterium]
MYSYTKKGSSKTKKRLLIAFSACLLIMVGVMSYSYRGPLGSKSDEPVIANQDKLVIALPNQEEKAIRPYKVDAKIVLGFFDGSDEAIKNVTEFEGTYRGNQGSDYSFENQVFDVVAILSGEVSEVRVDSLFGETIKIKSRDVEICYQSMKESGLKVGDKVKQNDILGKSSTNIYNKELGQHLHVVVEKKGQIINPESIYGKKVNDIN